jgi:hypothetical protein
MHEATGITANAQQVTAIVQGQAAVAALIAAIAIRMAIFLVDTVPHIEAESIRTTTPRNHMSGIPSDFLHNHALLAFQKREI